LRLTSVLLVLFAIGHTFGFSQTDPQWGIDSFLGSLRTSHFEVMGFSRTFWEFFIAAGLIVGVFYLFAAILAWQLGGLSPAALASVRGVLWAFALCFAVIAALSWRYLFAIPIAFSTLITIGLVAAAWGARKSGQG